MILSSTFWKPLKISCRRLTKQRESQPNYQLDKFVMNTHWPTSDILYIQQSASKCNLTKTSKRKPENNRKSGHLKLLKNNCKSKTEPNNRDLCFSIMNTKQLGFWADQHCAKQFKYEHDMNNITLWKHEQQNKTAHGYKATKGRLWNY